MLKFFSKVLFVSVLSGSLLLMDFSYKGLTLQSVRAETVKTEGVKDNDLMATLTMTVVGVIASRLYKYMPPTTDVMLAAAGGAAFLGGEILSTFKLKEVMKDMETEITRDKKGNINKEQIEALERLKKSYEQAKKTATTKKNLQMVAAAAFAAAGVAAITLKSSEMLAIQGCNAALVTAQTACPLGGTAAAAPIATLAALTGSREIPKPSMAQAPEEKATLALFNTELGGLSASLAAAAGTYSSNPKTAALAAACTAQQASIKVCAAVTTVLSTTTSSGIFGGLFTDINRMLPHAHLAAIPAEKSLLEKFVGLFVSDSHAALFSALGIASSAAIAYLFATSATLGPTVDTFLFTPMKRGMVWGVLAGLTFAATSATNNVISKIESNIQKIDAILKGMYSLGNGSTKNQVIQGNPNTNTITKKGGAIILNGANKYDDINLEDGNNGSLPCFTGSGEKKCESFEDKVKDIPSYSNLNSDSQAQLNDIFRTANAFNGTSKISGAALEGAAGLAGKAMAIQGAYDKAKNKLAESLKKSGSKYNLNDQSNKLANAINKDIADGLKKSKSSPRDMMANIYGSRGGFGSGNESSGAQGLANKDEQKGSGGAVGGANVFDLSSAGAIGQSDIDLGGSAPAGAEATTGMSAEELAAANAASSKSNPMDQYDLKNDITNDTGASIFELISNRYQRSGYPRLFKVKEQPPQPVKN